MVDCKSCEYETMCAMPEFVRNNLKSCKVYEPKEKKTNADRIRAMSDEELADFLFDFLQSYSFDTDIEVDDWLQSEVE